MSNTMSNQFGTPRTLGELFIQAGVDYTRPIQDLPFLGLTDDSRMVRQGWVFVAVRGEGVDGHRFIPQALEKGAAVVVAEAGDDGRIILVRDTHSAVGKLAQSAWGNPSQHIQLVGITGTNGKSTTAYLTEAALKAAGRRPVAMTTVDIRFEGESRPAPTTTPGAVAFAEILGRAWRQGADSGVMEVSSHALVQRRVEGAIFDVALMTNLTQDHLDYHGSMSEYAEAKRLLFTRYVPRVAVFNADDLVAREFAELHRGEKLTFGLDATHRPDFLAESLLADASGVTMTVRFPDGARVSFHSVLRGRFNASNLMGAIAIAEALGLERDYALKALSECRGAPGRFEAVDIGCDFAVYVDYAHTPDAVERLLENVRAITPGRVIALLGCGGDRDPMKRPIMGADLGRLADYSIVTTDNPRTEDPAAIAEAMAKGVRKTARKDAWEILLDRHEAIRRALTMARSGDAVVVAGKGHEPYQEVQGVRHHFDDREEVRHAAAELFGKGVENREYGV
jgi:UDP-N-acetylmuramoyl-L-alanyl-D-glutamate--2,6-diaminopimelate ligase